MLTFRIPRVLVPALVLAAACADTGGTGDDPRSTLDAGYTAPPPAVPAAPPVSYDAGAPAVSYPSPSSSGTPPTVPPSYDAGRPAVGGSSAPLPASDAGLDLGGLLSAGSSLFGASDGGASGSGAGKPPASGSASKCQNAVCVDVFDCFLWHPDLGDCGFTACEGAVCK
jgi:hypothetical protein